MEAVNRAISTTKLVFSDFDKNDKIGNMISLECGSLTHETKY